LTLDVFAAKGSRGWRLVRAAPMKATWLEGVRVGGAIPEPRKIRDAKPDYPEVAKGARVQGVVIMECLITPEGKVTAVRVLRGIPLLDAAAIEAVRRWEYTPTLIDGKPVPVIMTVTVNFRLR
jgi:protein TonB